MGQRYPRGSEWRRWDLHVHTPGTALNDQFTGWDDYLKAIEGYGTPIAVMGVTGYCSIAGYEELLSYKEAGRIQNVTLLIPNIEFRVTPQTHKGGAINLHLLVSPDEEDHRDKINDALSRLSFEYGKQKYSCVPQNLVRLGQAIDPKITDDQQAFRKGVECFKPDFSVFRDWYEKEGWLSKHSLVALSNGEDGASGLSKDSGFTGVRDELYRFAAVIFSGNPKDRAYFLGQGTDGVSEVVRKCAGLKPCVHGSDAHELKRLFEPDEGRYCWIKADPTFEGLRQIIYEPEDRLYIGPTSPLVPDPTQILSELEIQDAGAWFASPKIELNPSLVAVIGERGSGKTALADMIASACDAWEPTSTSFIQKAKSLLGAAVSKAVWADGRSVEGKVKESKLSDPKIRYLSQQFVEQLCSQDHVGKKLLAEIEAVIFSYIDEAERLGCSDFTELRDAIVQDLESEISQIRGRIASLNREIIRLEAQIASKSKKEERITAIDGEVKELEKQLPKPADESERKRAAVLEAEREALRSKTEELAAVNMRRRRVASARQKAERLFERTRAEYQELKAELTDLGLTAAEVAAFEPHIGDDYKKPLERIDGELEKQASTLLGNPEKPDPDGKTIADIKHRISELEKAVSADAKVRERVIFIQKKKSALLGEKQKLQKEVEKIEKISAPLLMQQKGERKEAYLKYFSVLEQEEGELAKLYHPLRETLVEGPEHERLLEFTIRRDIDVSGWASAGEAMINRRKDGPFRVRGDLERYAAEHLQPAWEANSLDQIGAAIDELLETFMGTDAVEDLLRSHVDLDQFLDWIFSVDHVRLSYGVKYEGIDLESLSPGTRGIVLLILYLAMDKADTRPLVIDQPEENLDNSSIYDALVPYIREAKKRRQIIIITHNPNLVVTTDAEQVIVATSEKEPANKHPRITYESGSLEYTEPETGTREAVCRILEGGAAAFHKREQRYALDDTAI